MKYSIRGGGENNEIAPSIFFEKLAELQYLIGQFLAV
mgnify:CR=1 FL=1